MSIMQEKKQEVNNKKGRRFKLNKSTNTRWIFGSTVAVLAFLVAIIGSCMRDNNKSNTYYGNNIDNVGYSDNQVQLPNNQFDFDATDQEQVKKLLYEYKEMFEEYGFKDVVNYKNLSYIIYYANFVKPPDYDSYLKNGLPGPNGEPSYEHFVNVFKETIEDIICINEQLLPNTYIPMAKVYGELNQKDRIIVQYFEEISKKLHNLHNVDNKDELSKELDAFFRFQLNFFVNEGSYTINGEEFFYETLSEVAAIMVSRISININENEKFVKEIPDFILVTVFNEATLEEEFVRYSTNDISRFIRTQAAERFTNFARRDLEQLTHNVKVLN